MDIDLKPFLEIPYIDLEEMNLTAKKKRISRVSSKKLRDFYVKYLQKEINVIAVDYIIDGLNNINTDTVKIMLADANSSALIEGYDDPSSLYVVMPMKL